MLASVLSLGLAGIEGFVVTTEVNLAPGMPAFDVVGLPDAAVKESRERVRAALRNCGHAFPNGRLIVNLAPADQKKEGPAFDLPIALGVLACAGEIDPQALSETAVLGELSLDGAVRSVRGALPMVISALEAGIGRVMLPEANLNEVRCVEGIEPFRRLPLKGCRGALYRQIAHLPHRAGAIRGTALAARTQRGLFCHVRGQKSAKRALEIAAAGGHNVLMIGPPGSGKTLMARCLPTILPDMTFQEALEVTRIHSVAGCVPETGLLTERPFRSPHHTASHAALVGGGANACPGRSPRRTTACCFWTNCPSTAATCWKRCASPWRTALSPWRG